MITLGIGLLEETFLESMQKEHRLLLERWNVYLKFLSRTTQTYTIRITNRYERHQRICTLTDKNRRILYINVKYKYFKYYSLAEKKVTYNLRIYLRIFYM
jgi:hypothetical protein